MSSTRTDETVEVIVYTCYEPEATGTRVIPIITIISITQDIMAMALSLREILEYDLALKVSPLLSALRAYRK